MTLAIEIIFSVKIVDNKSAWSFMITQTDIGETIYTSIYQSFFELRIIWRTFDRNSRSLANTTTNYWLRNTETSKFITGHRKRSGYIYLVFVNIQFLHCTERWVLVWIKQTTPTESNDFRLI